MRPKVGLNPRGPRLGELGGWAATKQPDSNNGYHRREGEQMIFLN